MLAIAIASGQCVAAAQKAKQKAPPPPAIIGVWDLNVRTKDGVRPSWLEVVPSGRSALVGRFVGAFGSARPVAEVRYGGGQFTFSIPPQWEDGPNDIVVEGTVAGNKVSGKIAGPYFEGAAFSGVRAPALTWKKDPAWGAPIELFNGHDLAGWRVRDPKGKKGWAVRNGILWNKDPGNDLVSIRKFTDFKVHVEFRYPKGSNSGVYLRGRYEAQIQDDFGKAPADDLLGSIYGFIEPRINAAKRPGEWQSYDITLVGRYVTITLNGETVVSRQKIPGITGGALDSDEGAPGPLFLQGDHGQIEFRKVVVTPAR